MELDTTLTQAGKAADAKAVGDAISKLSGGNVAYDETTGELTITGSRVSYNEDTGELTI